MPQVDIMTLSFSLAKFSSSQLRGEATTSRAMRATNSVPPARQALNSARAAASDGIGEPKQRENVRRVAAERGDHVAPALRVAGVERGDAAGGGVEIALDPAPGAVGECRREAALGADEFKTGLDEAILVGGEERRAGEQAQIHGIEIVPEPGQRHLGGLDGAARRRRALEHRHLPALGGEMDGGGQAVDAGTDDDRVVAHAALSRERGPILQA